MNGYDRLKLLHDMMNGDTKEPFRFSYDLVNRTGLNTRDFIAPTSFKFGEGRYFRMGSTIGAASYLQIIAPELSDRGRLLHQDHPFLRHQLPAGTE